GPAGASGPAAAECGKGGGARIRGGQRQWGAAQPPALAAGVSSERRLRSPTSSQAGPAPVAQAIAALAGEPPPDRGDGLCQTASDLPPRPRTPPRPHRLCRAGGRQSRLAQLLHLAQPATRPPEPGFRRSDRLVTQLSPSVSVAPDEK